MRGQDFTESNATIISIEFGDWHEIVAINPSKWATMRGAISCQ